MEIDATQLRAARAPAPHVSRLGTNTSRRRIHRGGSLRRAFPRETCGPSHFHGDVEQDRLPGRQLDRAPFRWRLRMLEADVVRSCRERDDARKRRRIEVLTVNDDLGPGLRNDPEIARTRGNELELACGPRGAVSRARA